MFVIGFIAGCIVGACFGVFMVALCVAAKCERCDHREEWEAV